MAELAELQHQVAYAMIAMAPENAEKLFCEGKAYVGYAELTYWWEDADGRKGWHDLKQNFSAQKEQIKTAVYNMREVEPFSQQDKPFTHYRITLTRDTPNIAIDLEYIPKEQSYPRVYMRPVGALTEAEAKALYVPYDEWHIRKQLYDGEITKAEFDAEMLRRDAAWEAEVKARNL